MTMLPMAVFFMAVFAMIMVVIVMVIVSVIVVLPNVLNVRLAEIYLDRGHKIAEVAKENGITRIRFDRGGYLYHGRVAALAGASSSSQTASRTPRNSSAMVNRSASFL